MTTATPTPIIPAIFGAGAVGTFVGTWLCEAGFPTRLLGRDWLRDAADAVEATRHDGTRATLGEVGRVVTDPNALEDANVCFVCVKSDDTRSVARTLRSTLRPGALVVSLQNGRSNPAVLEEQLGDRHTVAAGVVGFNVRRIDDVSFTETVAGALHLPDAHPALRVIGQQLREVGFDVVLHPDMQTVVDGKLLLNTNNGVSAASGLSVAELMRDADARWLFSACLREGLDVFAAGGRCAAKLAAMSPETMSRFLRLPNFIVRPLLRFGSVDEEAVTSTLGDLRRGRSTEIDHLNGEIVALGRQWGVPTPVNTALVEQVHAHEQTNAAGNAISYVPAKVLRRRCEAAANARPSTAATPS